MFGTKAHRAIAGAGIALSLGLSVAACGGGGDAVDKGALLKKVKADPDLKDNFAATKDKEKAAKCLVDAAEKYGDSDKLKDYLKGKGEFGNVVNDDKAEKASKDLSDCIK